MIETPEQLYQAIDEMGRMRVFWNLTGMKF